jgi:hypothetical protein
MHPPRRQGTRRKCSPITISSKNKRFEEPERVIANVKREPKRDDKNEEGRLDRLALKEQQPAKYISRSVSPEQRDD